MIAVTPRMTQMAHRHPYCALWMKNTTSLAGIVAKAYGVSTLLIVRLVRIGGHDDKNATYKCNVLVNRQVIYSTYITGHDRSDGWPALLQMLVDKASEANKDNKDAKRKDSV